MSSIGNKVKAARKQKKLTQAELAEGLLNRSYISQIEKGLVIPSYKILVSLAHRLDQDIHYFVEEQENTLLDFREIQKKLKKAQVHLELNEPSKAELVIKEIQHGQLAKLEDNEKGTYHWILGEVYLYKEDWDESIQCLLKSLKYLKLADNEKNVIKSLNSLAKAYMNSSKIEEALEKLAEAGNLLIKNQINDPLKVEVLLNTAICHGQLGEYRSAIRLCLEANQLNMLTKNNYKSGQIFMTLGICYKKTGETEKAKEFYLKANKLFEILEDRFHKAGILINLGILSRQVKELESSLGYLNSALVLFEELKDDQIYNCRIELVRTYIETREFSKAKKLALSTLPAIPVKYQSLKKQVFELITEIALEEENYEEALNYIIQAEEAIEGVSMNNLWIKKAKIYLKKADYKTAAEWFDKVLPDN